MSLFKREDREVLGSASAVFALVAALFAMFAFFTAVHADNRSLGAPAGAVQVSLGEFTITPAMITAPPGGKLVVSNAGSVEHNFVDRGHRCRDQDAQRRRVADARPERARRPGTYTVSCGVAGHKQAGMVAMLHLGTGAVGRRHGERRRRSCARTTRPTR